MKRIIQDICLKLGVIILSNKLLELSAVFSGTIALCDGILSNSLKNQPEELLTKLNNYHPNIKFSKEVNARKFLDSEISHIITARYIFQFLEKKQNIKSHWSSAIHKIYQIDEIQEHLHRAKQISINHESKLTQIKKRKNAEVPIFRLTLLKLYWPIFDQSSTYVETR